MRDHSGPRGSHDEDWELLSVEASRPGSPAFLTLPPSCNQANAPNPHSDGVSDLASSLTHLPSVTLSDSQDSQSLLLVAGNSSSPAPKDSVGLASPFAGASDSSLMFDSIPRPDEPLNLSLHGSSMSEESSFDTHPTSYQRTEQHLSLPTCPEHRPDNGSESSAIKLSLQPDTSSSNRLVYAALEISDTAEKGSDTHMPVADDSSNMVTMGSRKSASSDDEMMTECPPVSASTNDALAYAQEAKQPLTLLLLGKTGNGKSSTGNTILGYRAFQAKCSARSVTTYSQAETAIFGRAVTVIDTPGLFDTAASQTEVCNELARAMAMSEQGIHAILLVLTTSSRFTAEEVACLNYLRSAYGGQLLRHCILVFTHGDSLEEEETPLHEFLRNCPDSLQVVLNEVQGRQVAINNRAGNSNGQVDALLGHVDSLLSSNNNTLFRPSDTVPPAIISIGETGSAAELEQLRMKYDSSEAARKNLEKRVKDSSTMQKRLITACTVGGLLGWKLLHSGAGSTSIPMPPPELHPGNVPSQMTWAFEPAALGLTPCSNGPQEKINVLGLDRLISTTSHQQ